MSGNRQQLAEAFLREAVYRSRSKQAAGTALSGVSHDDDFAPGRCGLGGQAAVELGLDEKGEELFLALWPDGLEADAVRRVQGVLSDWIAEQDALDRKRNHFLRDFRQAHGLDRGAYGPEESQTFERGLEEVNAGVNERLRAAAAQLLGEG